MRGYVLVACLMFIAMISLICLSLFQQVHLQQKLVGWQMQSNQAQIQLVDAIQTMQQKLSHHPPACILPREKSLQVFDDLMLSRLNACTEHLANFELRYIFVTADAGHPAYVAMIMRESSQANWQKFHLELVFPAFDPAWGS